MKNEAIKQFNFLVKWSIFFRFTTFISLLKHVKLQTLELSTVLFYCLQNEFFAFLKHRRAKKSTKCEVGLRTENKRMHLILQHG